MGDIEVILRLWDEVRKHGIKTIELIEEADCWGYRVNEHEHSVR
ncbi:MAG: hypothetical protein Q6361_08205 [Candidatus Hermodarchaeota archaeon]|nr:hypothetical protein [Candidatus Hermodarchaeota archaeon]